MNVLVIADPIIPVPPHGYGGTERIVGLLCDGLMARGHRVTLMAREGSRRYDGLIVHRPPDNRSYASRAFRKLWFQLLSVGSLGDVDVVHNFGRTDYLEALLRTDRPLVCTFQNPVSEREVRFITARRRGRFMLTSISNRQRLGLDQLAPWRTVYNAADVERLQFNAGMRAGYLAFLGRITANKGAHLAIRVARATGRKLKLAGNISNEPGGVEFFEREVRPQLGSQIEWVGEVDDRQKQEFLGNADALLMPIQWDEPFGIVMAESLATGTPVIALRRGSVPEVIKHGKVGFVCDSEAELVEAVGKVPEIDRAACRAHVEQHFSADAMVKRYLEVYSELLDAGHAPSVCDREVPPCPLAS